MAKVSKHMLRVVRRWLIRLKTNVYSSNPAHLSFKTHVNHSIQRRIELKTYVYSSNNAYLTFKTDVNST